MLYNERWSREYVRVYHTYSLPSFIAWLEKQPPDTNYDWNSTSNCVACQYLKAQGVQPLWGGNYSDLDTIFPSIQAYWRIGATQPTTFGAALARARKEQTYGNEGNISWRWSLCEL